jgi:ABC-type proline/glycine betaine transport system permease subunit
MSVISKLSLSAQTTLGDARVAATIGAGTTGLSFAQVMGWLQSNIGFIGAIAGVVLTAVTIWVQVSVGRREYAAHAATRERNRVELEKAKLETEKSKLELELLRRQLGTNNQ